jgi:hypothetical protein
MGNVIICTFHTGYERFNSLKHAVEGNGELVDLILMSFDRYSFFQRPVRHGHGGTGQFHYS